MQIQTIFELYIDDNKLKYSRNLKDILQSAKNNYEKMYTKQITTDATNDFLAKLLTERKDLTDTLIFLKQKYLEMKKQNM